MKVRFGVAFGADVEPADFAAYVDRIEAAGIDSLWLSERVYSTAIEPFVGLAFALARTEQLKVGTSVAVLPGRHPVLVAKALASLAALAPGRVLPVFGLKAAATDEVELFPAPAGERGALFDESLVLLRAALAGDVDQFDGRFVSARRVRIAPSPAGALDIWLGGSAPAGLRRVGRFGDGWLGSFLTPAEAGRARDAIDAAAQAAGRSIDPDHFGISLVVTDGDLPEPLATVISRRRSDVPPRELVAAGWDDLHRLVDGYVAAGLSKFVIRPAGAWTTGEFLTDFRRELVPRQT